MSGTVYRVTFKLPKGSIGTVIVEAHDREQAKARGLNQIRSMGHEKVTAADVILCRKQDKPTVFGNWPITPIGGNAG